MDHVYLINSRSFIKATLSNWISYAFNWQKPNVILVPSLILILNTYLNLLVFFLCFVGKTF